jgi:PRTRC genetic system protein C
MFQELMPLLAQRILLLTLSRVSDEQICVNVIPKSLKSDQRDDDSALTTPLGVTGTPKELDEQLPSQLMEFVETHLGLSSTLKSAKEQMEAAARAAREAARKPTNSKSHSGSSRSAIPSPAKVQTEAGTIESSGDSQSSPALTQVATVGTESGSLVASTGSLFDVEPKNDNRRLSNDPVASNHYISSSKGVVMEVHRLEREFVYNGVKLPDTTPTMTPEQVRDTYTHLYPEMATAAIEGPDTVAGKLVYKFVRAIGAKG